MIFFAFVLFSCIQWNYVKVKVLMYVSFVDYPYECSETLNSTTKNACGYFQICKDPCKLGALCITFMLQISTSGLF